MEITFEIGNENRPQIEKIDENSINNSIFSEQYQYALKALNNYMSVISPDGSTNEKERFSSLTDANNNIFAFIGDRGSGKTSCMMSLAAFLNEPDKKVLSKYKDQGLEKHSNFYALDPVDPSFFDKDHNILSIILAKLYAKYKKEKEDEKKEIDSCKELELIRLFNDTQRDLAYMTEKPNPDNDNLRQLESLSAAVDLKDDIKKLVEMFFKCFNMKTDTTLLLIIDDIDLNTTEAEIMAEQIRKYFVQQGIVILMALKLDQLEMVKRLSLAKEYKVLLDKVIHMPDLDEMVERYLAKFLPHNQRFYMPDSDYYMESKLNITKGKGTNSYTSVKQAVPELIFQKTRYLFYNSPQHVSYIVPRNLRGLRQIISLLYDMDDYWVDDTDMRTYNKTLFKKYLFDNWTVNNLNNVDKTYINELVAVEDMSLFNNHTLKILQARFPDNFKIEDLTETNSDEEREVFYLKNPTNMSYNISSGDVLSLMDMFERQYTYLEDQHFLFILRSLYSMRLYETYDKVTEYESTTSKTSNDSQKIVMRNDQFYDLSEYDKLVGGRFINSRMTDLLPHPKETYLPSRSNRQIDISTLNLLIKECVEKWDNTSVNIKKMVEFFMLCIARDFHTRHKDKNTDFYDPSYRTRRNINYSMSLKNNTNVFFDINSFMFNVTRIKKCFCRFSNGEEFFEKADMDKDTLLGKFKLATLKERQQNIKEEERTIDKYDYHKWLSFCSLRNAEIIQDLHLFLENYEYKGSDDINLLSQYFKRIGEYSILSYDKKQGEESHYDINFNFANDVGEYLEKIDDSGKETFLKIYSKISMSPIIDIESVLRNRHEEKRNMTRTVISFIKSHYPIYETEEYTSILNDVFNLYGDRISREEIREAVENIYSKVENGESQADTESSVSEEESTTNS